MFKLRWTSLFWTKSKADAISRNVLIRFCTNRHCRQDFELRLNDDPIHRHHHDRPMIANRRLIHRSTSRHHHRLVYFATASWCQWYRPRARLFCSQSTLYRPIDTDRLWLPAPNWITEIIESVIYCRISKWNKFEV